MVLTQFKNVSTLEHIVIQHIKTLREKTHIINAFHKSSTHLIKTL